MGRLALRRRTSGLWAAAGIIAKTKRSGTRIILRSEFILPELCIGRGFPLVVAQRLPVTGGSRYSDTGADFLCWRLIGPAKSRSGKLDPSGRPSQDRSRNTPITSSFAREFRGVPEGLKQLGVWPARPILGMPLHREHKALSRQLQGLYYVVRCSCDDHKPARHMVHALIDRKSTRLNSSHLGISY